MTVRELLAAFSRHHDTAGIHGEKTRKKLGFIFDLLVAAHGDAPSADFQPADLKSFVIGHRGWKTISTRMDVYDTIKGVWGWALREGRVAHSPFHKALPVPDEPATPEILPDGSDAQPLRTVGEVIAMYLRHFGGKRNVEAAENTRRNLDNFAAIHGGLLLSEVRRHHLLLWVASHKRWVSHWTKRRGLGDIRGAFGWALRMGFIALNPFAGASLPKGGRRRAMEATDFQSLLRNTTPVFRRVLIFLRFSGARPIEMATAEWRMYDANRNCLVMEEHKTAHSNGGAPRTIMLHPVVIKLLLWIKRNRFHPRYIFINKRGRPWNKHALYCRIRDIREFGGIPPGVSLYQLRHLFVTQSILSGIDLPTVAELAGHKRIDTTMIYAHVSGRTDHLQQALVSMFDKSPTNGKGIPSCRS